MERGGSGLSKNGIIFKIPWMESGKKTSSKFSFFTIQNPAEVNVA